MRTRLAPRWFGTWTAGDDVALEMAMYRAYHRWMDDYCGAYPNRLGGVILAGARNIDGALAEIRRWGRASWSWGLMVYAPVGMPLDHPALEPLYAEPPSSTSQSCFIPSR
jgi:hypothetical protein